MLSRKRIGKPIGFCLRPPQQQLLLVQRPPLRNFVDQPALILRSRGGRQSGFRSLRRSFVLFDHRLNAVLRIAAGTNQILLGVINFVLIKFLLRVRNFQLIVQRIFGFARGFRNGCGQLRYLRLIAR